MSQVPPNSTARLAAQALAFYNARRLGEAEVLYRRILAVQPMHAEALGMMGVLALEVQRYNEAEKFFRRSLEIEPQSPGTLNNLGAVLRQTGRLREGVECYRRAAALAPTLVPVLVTLGCGLRDIGEFAEAQAVIERALALDPNYGLAHFGLSTILLRQGDFRRGLVEYEWRQKYGMFQTEYASHARPVWDGAPLSGKRILLHAEQGLGDTLNFIRFVPLVMERGGEVVVHCQKELKGLLAGSVRGVREWVSQGEVIPAHDVQCLLMSLPRVLGTTPESIPGQAKIEAADADVRKWSEILSDDGEGMRVGLCWSGNPSHIDDSYRSIPLSRFKAIADVRGVNFYSLQKQARAADTKLPLPICFFDYTEKLGDFSDTAAMVANLDLVITADTSIVHLAGAMGKKAWLLLATVSDWRWFGDREDSPWYPTVRLFRQRVVGDWDEVMGRIRGELEALVAGAG